MLHGIQSLLCGKLATSKSQAEGGLSDRICKTLTLFLSPFLPFGRKNAIKDPRGGPDSRFFYRAYFMEKSDPHWLWKTWKILARWLQGRGNLTKSVGKCVSIEVWKWKTRVKRATCIALQANLPHKREINPFRNCFSTYHMLVLRRLVGKWSVILERRTAKQCTVACWCLSVEFG